MADKYKTNATDMPKLIAIGMALLPTARENAKMDMKKRVVVRVGMEAAVGLGLRPCAVEAQMTLFYDPNHCVTCTLRIIVCVG